QAPAGARARALSGADEDIVLEEAAVGDRGVDPGQVLLDDRAGSEVEVPDLGVAHLPVGKADVVPRGGQSRVRVAVPEGGERGRLRLRDRVPRAGLGKPPAVEDDEREAIDRDRVRAAWNVAHRFLLTPP